MRAALILFDDDDPAPPVLGVPWPEFRLRSAVRAGAMHIVVVAGRITPQIVTAIDRARDAGVSAALARTAVEIADLFHPEEAVLLLSGAGVVDDRTLAALMSAEQPALACVDAGAGVQWELMDAQTRWTGLARLDGAQIRGTATMVGDWDLGSTLLRQAVTGKAGRLMLGERDLLWRADNAGEGAFAARQIIADAGGCSGGWAARAIIRPVTRLGATALADRLAAIAPFAPALAIAPLIAAVVLAWFKWPVLAALLLFLGCLFDAFGSLVERATGVAPRFDAWRYWGLNGAAVAALAGVVVSSSADHAPLVLAIMLVVMVTLAGRLRGFGDDPRWLAGIPELIIVIGAASIFGPAGTLAGLVIALIYATAGLVWLQNRLSSVLTQSR